MIKNVFLNTKSQDKRIPELIKIMEANGAAVYDLLGNAPTERLGNNSLCVLEPRLKPDIELFKNLPYGTTVFGYPSSLDDNLLRLKNLKYISLSEDEEFIRENNYLTALAMKEILDTRFGTDLRNVLIIGWGRLCVQLEKVLKGIDIHVLNFNLHKVQQLQEEYGDRAHFEFVDLSQFQVVINTVPKEVVGEKMLRTIHNCTTCKLQEPVLTTIYELASEPYGFDWGGLDKTKFDYVIEPALPGRYYPDKAAEAVFNCIWRHLQAQIMKPSIVLCITGSSCSYLKLIPVLKELVEKYDVIPCLSDNANSRNRFVNIEEFKLNLEQITGNKIITHMAASELLSQNKRVVASVVFPATGNTIGKLANAITDTPVTMAVKALLRNSKPCILGISTNDALSGQAENIGKLLVRKNYFFVPFSQDDPVGKPFSMICDFSKVGATIEAALQGRQIQPIIG